MTKLFKKAAVFTDIHFGLKSNSQVHNEDCLNFIKWMTKTAKEHGCETCLFLGDYHNNRASINIMTLNYSLRALEHLNDNFDQVFFIPGNHDLYYRDRRDVQSVEWAKHLSRVQIVNDWFEQDDVVIAPWLIGDDHKRILKMSAKYCFGHFELPHFLMNAHVEMPDHGEINSDYFSGFEQVFSGHFHKRQHKQNITYIGNCFPHNYSDNGDDNRGMMILEWDESPHYVTWQQQPRYRVFKLSEVLDHADNILKPKMHCRVNLDIDISFEEAAFIREQLVPKYNLREMTLIPIKHDIESDNTDYKNLVFESVDQIVQTQIESLQEGNFDRKLLLEIYRSL